jgi:predicted ATPase
MKRNILTGAPGAGKTALLRQLEREGYAIVEEAATAVNVLAIARGAAEPWKEPSFIDDIVALQQRRQLRADGWPDEVLVFDRSPICTWALCEFLGLEPPARLREELDRIERQRLYEPRVFFVENLGSCAPTEVRRISFEDSLRFEAVHADVYRRFGYQLCRVPAADIPARVEILTRHLGPPR